MFSLPARLILLALLMCGCATTGYYPSTSTGAQNLTVRNAPAGITHACNLERIRRGDRLPLKLDVASIQLLNTLDKGADSAETVRAFRERFYASGDYPVLSLQIISQFSQSMASDRNPYPNIPNTDLWTYNVECDMSATITLPGQGSPAFETSVSSTCTSTRKEGATEFLQEEATKAIGGVSLRALASAANKLLNDLESKRAQLDDIHGEFLFSN